MKLNYYLNPKDVEDFNDRKWRELDKKAESSYIQELQANCQLEIRQRNRMIDEAQGWFFPNMEKMRQAKTMEMKSCHRLGDFGYSSY